MALLESILLIEDDPQDWREIEMNIRQSLSEVAIDRVVNVTEALQWIRKKPVQLIITEHRPPEVDCFGLLLALRRSDISIPVIVITAHGDERTAVESMKLGAYDYFPKDELKHLSIGHAIESVLERKHLRDELEESAKRLKELAIRDGLTSLYNRRYFAELLDREFRRARRYHHPLSLILIDIDFFKSVNDTYGHKMGDSVIEKVAELINGSVRNVDLVARYGGDEFCVAMPETTLEQALILAQRMQKMIASHPFAVPGAGSIRIGSSMGVTALSHKFLNREDLVASADRALYEAKKRGRGTVCSDAEVVETGPLLVDCERIGEINENVRLLSDRIKSGYLEQVLGYLSAMSSSDTGLPGHAERVAALAADLAMALGLSETEVAHIRNAGLLHDIGKVALDQKVLMKKEGLSHDEHHLIQKHPVIGAQILQQVKFLENEVPLVLHHHERFDGSGYPGRLRGFEIPLGSRILSLVEAWDTMRSDQPYRKALSVGMSLKEIEDGAGHQFDANIVQEFLKLMEEKGESLETVSQSNR